MSDPMRPTPETSPSFRFAVNVTPKPGILDPQGRAVEGSLPHLGIAGVHDVRVGRRVELTVDAVDENGARTIVERLAGELLSNPLIETVSIELLAGMSAIVSSRTRRPDGPDTEDRS
jgi:phosphoribosylformylglycinamidine synthase PurS subunit